MGIESNTETVMEKNEELVELRQAQEAHNQEVESARATQAKARTAVMQKEKGIKKAEKALEAKVFQVFIVRSILE
jgi:structural maintenance of chromosome 1